MNKCLGTAPERPYILELWWLKARRSASGQNNAAVRAAKYDEHLTTISLMLPALVFALSFCNSVAVRFNYVFWLTFDDLITIATGLTLALTTYQFGKDYKVRAIEHRLASNEFDALVQLIEATGFTDVDDRNFADIDSRLERIRRTVRHVPERDWKAARRAFGKDISGARNRIRPAATLPQHEDHN